VRGRQISDEEAVSTRTGNMEARDVDAVLEHGRQSYVPLRLAGSHPPGAASRPSV
jgi:hypothetical protein